MKDIQGNLKKVCSHSFKSCKRKKGRLVSSLSLSLSLLHFTLPPSFFLFTLSLFLSLSCNAHILSLSLSLTLSLTLSFRSSLSFSPGASWQPTNDSRGHCRILDDEAGQGVT